MLLAGCGATTNVESDGGDDMPRVSRVPMTTPRPPSDPDAEFSDSITSLPIAYEDARLLAISSCLAFRQNPGTTYASAVRQLAQQQAWSDDQSRTFLNATTEAYCPEFRGGS